MDLGNRVNTSQELLCFDILADNSKLLDTWIAPTASPFVFIAATNANLLVLVTKWRSPNLHFPSNTSIRTSDEMRFLSHTNQSLNDGGHSPQYGMDPAHTLIDSERAMCLP